MEIKGTLPVALKMVDGQTEIKSKQVVMRSLTTIEYISQQAQAKDGQYLGVFELTSMTKLIDEEGQEHAITYDMLGCSSHSNYVYLQGLKEDLEAKEQAES